MHQNHLHARILHEFQTILARQKIASEAATQEQIKKQIKEQIQGKEVETHADRRHLEAASPSPRDSRSQLVGHNLGGSQLELSPSLDGLTARLTIESQPSAEWGAIEDVLIEDLLEEEQLTPRQRYERQLQSLEAKIQQQTEQITELSMQLQTALRQAQKLAIRVQRSSIRIAAKSK